MRKSMMALVLISIHGRVLRKNRTLLCCFFACYDKTQLILIPSLAVSLGEVDAGNPRRYNFFYVSIELIQALLRSTVKMLLI